jgi:hypothetical protein
MIWDVYVLDKFQGLFGYDFFGVIFYLSFNRHWCKKLSTLFA